MTSPLFEARGVSKRYRVRTERSLALGLTRRARPKDVWALRALDLHVDAGEVVAVIGRNGAGKSTLLKLASGVATPTTGTVRRPRRLAPLIEVGAGFHPELTGRENVDVNARLLGLSGRQIQRSFDDIVAFAELAHVIDQPVRQYSSGMFMRLGFAVAIHTEPELLIVDEVLAVGDLPFQVRCLDRIRELRDAGTGVLFVSHNLTAVLSLASRAVLLQKGQALHAGPTNEVVGAYHDSLSIPEVSSVSSVGEDGAPSAKLELSELRVTGTAGQPVALWEPGQRVVLSFRLTALEPTPSGVFGISIRKDGAGEIARWMAEEAPAFPALDKGEAVQLAVTFDLNVAEGGYLLDLGVLAQDRTAFLHYAMGIQRFGVGPRRGGAGIVDVAPSLVVRRA